MSRISHPIGYLSWNDYINAQADASPDQSIEARRLIKRDIKLGIIAAVERDPDVNPNSVSWRTYSQYSSPGTVSPVEGHPWLPKISQLSLEDENGQLGSEDGDILLAGQANGNN